IKTFVDNEPILEICFFGDKAYETTWRDALKPNPPHDWYKPSKSFFDKGKYPSTTVNPWSGEQASFEPAAPFDQEFYLIMNLAVGGNGGYFPDGIGNKPWKNFGSPGQASRDFWKAKDSNWGHTWKEDLSRAFAIDYVKAYDLC
ncbi:glycoside hydrolase family 16 protein, partial [Conidiobolus coronatus NRRL 28638]